MSYYILYNPLSGNGKGKEDAEAVSVIYDDKVFLEDITGISDHSDFFNRLDEEDSVVVCGGDGTLNRFANAIDGIDIKCEILYYGNGTGNDFLRDIGRQAGDNPIRVNKYLKDLPVVELRGKRYRFLNGVGFGLDGYCCGVGDEMKKRSDKPVNYALIAIKGLLFYYKPTKAVVTVDGISYTYEKVWIAPTMNGRFYGGGMMPAPEQDRLNETGEVSLVVLHGAGKLKTLSVFPSIFKGTHTKHTGMVAVHTGKNISVEFDRPVVVQVDGETFWGIDKYRVESGAREATVCKNIKGAARLPLR